MTTNREEVVERMVEAYCSNKSPQCMDAMRAALSIAEEAVLEELMEATPEMDEAGHQAMGWGNAQVWQAMLTASPLYRRVKGE